MRTIWKVQLEVEEHPTIFVPTGARFLAVQEQHARPCLWFEVDPEREPEQRTFRIYGTGHPLDTDHDDLAYRGTFQMLGGSFVGHLYERGSA